MIGTAVIREEMKVSIQFSQFARKMLEPQVRFLID